MPISMQLIRVATGSNGTFGVLVNGGIPFAVTLERPWRDNVRSLSCIPYGLYRCLRCRVSPDYNGDSPKFGNTFQVYNVPGRSTILFHKGNLDDDTHGCILVGESFDPIHGRPGIVASTKGFAEFLATLKNVDEFQLEIREA